MKKDQYFPHEVHTRNYKEVMYLIEKEGATGYGIYWALMEYLRTQDDYVGDVIVLRSLARQLRTKLCKVESVLRNYDLFVVRDFSFRSIKLEMVMKPLDEKRKAMEKKIVGRSNLMTTQNTSKLDSELGQSECKMEVEFEQKKDNSLNANQEVREFVSTVKKSKVKKSKVLSSISSSVAGEVETSNVLPKFLPAWEKYVDELQFDEQWKELMAMRTGLKQSFFSLFPQIVENFKNHVRSIGNEGRISSFSDAKHYFFFYLDPGSVTFKRLVRELQKPVDKGKYKYEERDPVTGKRSYCGVSIPDDAPPRPNEQAVWCEGKWVF